MKRMILALLCGIFLLSGCRKSDSVIYSGLESGRIESGVFTTDNGVRMTVVGNEGKLDVNTSRRVLLSYRTHPLTGNGDVDIDVQGIWDARIVDPSPAESFPADPSGSPVQVTDAWFSAGYLNILASYPCDDPATQEISAAYMAGTDGIKLRLLHEGGVGNKQEDVFLSVPMESPANAYREIRKPLATFPVAVLLQWSWYALDNGPLMLYERKGSYSPEF